MNPYDAVMDRDEYEKVIADFMKMHFVKVQISTGKKMTVITVVNPESLGTTEAEVRENLFRLAEAGFLIVTGSIRFFYARLIVAEAACSFVRFQSGVRSTKATRAAGAQRAAILFLQKIRTTQGVILHCRRGSSQLAKADALPWSRQRA